MVGLYLITPPEGNPLPSVEAALSALPRGADPKILVVLPFRDTSAAGSRVRNLLAVLLALRDQSFERRAYRVTVVESDETPRWKDAIAPLSHIPAATERSVPQFLVRGTVDSLIKDEMVKEFTDALVKAGQRAEYVQVGGASHAFFDWKPDAATKGTFAKYGPYYAAEMKAFFNSVLY